MQQALVPKSPLLPFKHSLLLDQILYPKIPLQSIEIGRNSPSPTSSFLNSHNTQIQKWVICVEKSGRRYGSQKSMKLILELISVLGLNVQILPPPLVLLVGELSDGDEGKIGFWRNIVGGIFDLWKRKLKRKRKVILEFWISLGLFSLYLLPGKILNLEVIFGILGFGLLGIFLIKKWRKWLKSWVFGFCCFAFLIALVYKGEDAIKLGKKFRVSSSMVDIVRGARRKGRGREREEEHFKGIHYFLCSIPCANFKGNFFCHRKRSC